jgi:signal peptidase I
MFFRKDIKELKKKKTLLYSTIEFILLLMLVFFIRTFFFGLYQVPTGSMETTMLVGERFFADKLSFVFRNPTRGEIIAFNDPTFTYSKNSLKRAFEEYVWGPSNWTKRVIGIPGDHVRGTIEDGKPVVYLNGVKLDESYINKYALVHKWSKSPDILKQAERKKLVDEGIDIFAKPDRVEAYINHQVARFSDWRSYDPAYAFDKQPFYKMDETLIDRDQAGNLIERRPYESMGNDNALPYKKPVPGRIWTGTDEFDVQLQDDEYWCMGDNRRGSWDCRGFGPLKRRLIHGRILFRIISIDSTDSWLIFDILKHPIEFWSRIRWNRFLQRVI